MSLTKAKLLHFGRLVSKQGFLPVLDRTRNAVAHYYSVQPNGLVLNLVLEASSSSPGSLTASFYLSISFTWGYMPQKFPSTAYDRVGAFLTFEERKRLSRNSELKATVVDVWTADDSEGSIQLLGDAIACAFPRFLDRPNVVSLLAASDGLRMHAKVLSRVLAALGDGPGRTEKRNGYLAYSAEFLPEVCGGTPHPNLVKLTATDAERVDKHLGRHWSSPDVLGWNA